MALTESGRASSAPEAASDLTRPVWGTMARSGLEPVMRSASREGEEEWTTSIPVQASKLARDASRRAASSPCREEAMVTAGTPPEAEVVEAAV